MFNYFATAFLVATISIDAMPAVANTSNMCAPRADVVKKLKQKYHESHYALGISSPNVVTEIWSSDDKGTFTIFKTDTNGVSCIISAGDGWVFIPKPVGPKL